MNRLVVGTEVIVIRGNDKGKRGKVAKLLADKGRVVVEGVNTVKRHLKATPQRGGGILQVEAPLPVLACHAGRSLIRQADSRSREDRW